MRTIAALCLIALACLAHLFAQENPTANNIPCISSSEAVYKPGVDGVKPPQPQPSKRDRTAPDLRGPASLELLVNSEGSVCNARVLTAKDKLSAQKSAKYISENWTFKPAMKQGKPVAVKFTMNFNPR
jgi:TonB family protein